MGLLLNCNVLLFVHHERLNPVVSITIGTIFIEFEWKFLMGRCVKYIVEG